MNRLQQFWNFGHNCAVCLFSLDEVNAILEDFRFTSWALSREEKFEFTKGYHSRPFQWTRKDLRPISVRPIIHEPLEHTHDREANGLVRRRESARRLDPVVLEGKALKNSRRSKEYWNSPKGEALKIKLRNDRRREHLQKQARS